MEHAEGSVVIEAPLEDVMEVIEDYESYPEWSEVQTVDIRQRGEGGRAYEVAYEVDVPVLGKAAYTLAYVYPDAPADAWRWHGLSLFKQGQTAQGRAALSRYLTIKPDAADAPFIRQMIS